MASWRGVLAIALLASACGACSGSKTATPAADAGPGTWTAAAALPEPRFEAYSAVVRGKIYFFGGIRGTGTDPRDATVSDHVDIYDPRANVWAPGPPLPADSARHHLAVGVVGDVVYLLGGFVGILGATPTMTPNGHAYRLEGDRWGQDRRRPGGARRLDRTGHRRQALCGGRGQRRSHLLRRALRLRSERGRVAAPRADEGGPPAPRVVRDRRQVARRRRSTVAYFKDADGTAYLYASGSTKAAVDASANVPPSLARLRVMTRPGAPAWLAIDAVDQELAFKNPGAPVVTSNGTRDAIVWVVDPNGLRTDSLLGCDAPAPILYAVDARTMRLLWKSAPGQLHVGGKYSTAVVAHGVVFVGTDRIQAFGLRD